MPERRVWLWRIGAEIGHRVREHDLRMMAAAVAFYWLLGLLPLLLLGTSAVGYLLGSSERAVDEVVAAAFRLVPRATGPEVGTFLAALIRSRHLTGLLGIGGLLWAAMGSFGVIVSSLTALTGDRDSRSFLRRRLIAFILMGTAGFLMVVALMGGWVLAAWPKILSSCSGSFPPRSSCCLGAYWPTSSTERPAGISPQLTLLSVKPRTLASTT